MDYRFLRSLLTHARRATGSERMRLLAIAEDLVQSGEDFSVDEEIWRTTEQGKHYALETETGEITKGNIGQGRANKTSEEYTGPSGRTTPKTVKQANAHVETIIKASGDGEKLIEDLTEVLRSADKGTKIRMPDSWNDDDGKPTIYEKNENGNWEDKTWGGSISAAEMAGYMANGADDPDETPKFAKFFPNEKYVPGSDIKWTTSKKIGEEDFRERFSELVDNDEMYEAIDRARGNLYDGQSQFFGRYMHGVGYGSEAHNAFNSYNYHGDTLINGMLRGSTPRDEEQSKEWAENKERTRKYIDQMTRACDENPLREDAVVFRGIEKPSGLMKALGLSLPEGTDVKDLFYDRDFVESLVGRTFSDPGFTSTSIDKEFPRKGGFDKTATMEILLPKGTKGTYFGDALRITDEHEYLLQRGTQFMICSAYTTEYDGPRLNLRVVVVGQEPQEIPELKSWGEKNGSE